MKFSTFFNELVQLFFDPSCWLWPEVMLLRSPPTLNLRRCNMLLTSYMNIIPTKVKLCMISKSLKVDICMLVLGLIFILVLFEVMYHLQGIH